MGKEFLKKTADLLQTKHKRKQWQKIMISLSLVVAMLTSILLIHPAITMERKVVCGHEEHTHSNGCYEKKLICGKEEHTKSDETDTAEEHTHTDACYEEVLTCSKQEHTHSEACYAKEEPATTEATTTVSEDTEKASDSSEEKKAEEPAEATTEEKKEEATTEAAEQTTEEAKAEARTLTAKGKDYTVQVDCPAEAKIPAEAKLVVKEIKKNSDDYEKYYKKTEEAVAKGEDTEISFARFFDISFEVDGKEIEPAAKVEVKITYDDKVEVADTGKVKSVHFDDKGKTEVLNVKTNEKNGKMDEVKFDAKSFSVYAIVGTTKIENGSSGISVMSIGGNDSVSVEVGQTLTISSAVTDRKVGSQTIWGHTTYYHESWNSNDETVAKVAGVPDATDGDDQYKETSATITGITPGTVTITHIYYTTTQTSWGTTNWQSQTETITVNVIEPKVYTVSFNIGTEAETAGVTVPDSLTVRSGETVSNLPTLAWKDENGDYIKIFAGWYTDEGMTTEFTDSTPVVSDMTLYASWVDVDEEGMYYVNFYSQDGKTVYLTLAVAVGKTVNPADGPTMTDYVFKGWSTQMQNDSLISDLSTFDFGTPVSSAVTEGDNTLNLYAWYAPAVKVSFISNGGTAVPTQFIAQGEKAENVTTTRTGYTFEGWYTDKDLTQAFDFNTSVTMDIVLYAKWTAKMVPVTLVYMYENADDDNYSPAGGTNPTTVVYAPAGSYVSIEKTDNITTKTATHNVRYSDTANSENFTGYATTNETGSTNATISDVRDTYYQYNNATNKRYVKPDGSTVVLVYYNRARVTLTFQYTLNKDAFFNVNENISAENQSKYKTNYETTNNGFEYKFTAKVGQDITSVWLQIKWVNNPGNFYTWYCPDEHLQTSNMYTLETSLFKTKNGDGVYIQDGVLVGSGNLTSQGKTVKKVWLIYARTTLPGETVDFVYNNKNYTIYTEACQLGYAPDGVFGYKALDGCENTTDDRLKTTYGNQMNISKLTANNGTLKNKFDMVFPDDQINNGDNCQVLLYDRDSLTLNVITNVPGFTGNTFTSYLYGDWIYNDDNDLLKQLETDMVREGFRFAGWYTDSEFTSGTEYTLSEDSRITANMMLYAKWEPDQFIAEYYLYMDDSSPYATQGFAEGGMIDDKFVPAAVQDQFLGWYWYQNGTLVPFDFTSTVGQAHVDSNDVLKLYAKWEGTTGKVSYLPGIGGDNATQEVIDSRDFEINQAAVQLLVYTDVWKSGIPTNSELTFVGWKAPNGKIYQPGRYVLVTRQLMQFEAQWSQDAVTLIYDANGGNGANVTEKWDRNSEVDIWDNMDANTPHFTRDDYDLIGWDTNKNATNPTYKLGEGTITLSNDTTTLYAIWKKNVVDVKLKKVDDKNDVISGAHFNLSKLQNTIWQEVNSDITPGDGTNNNSNPFDLGNLKVGRYKLQETSAPDGYIILNSDVYFEICNNADGNLIVQLTDEEGNAMNTSGDISSVAVQEDGSYTITIKNTPGQELPHTGGSGTLPYTLGGLLLMFAAALMYGFKLRRRGRRLS